MIGVYQDNVLGVYQFQYSIVKNVERSMLQMKALKKYQKYSEKKVQMHGLI